MAAFVRVTSSGQITIPADLRRKHNIAPGDRVLVRGDDLGRIIIRSGKLGVDDLVGIFPLRPGVQTQGDFDDLIGEAFMEGYARKWASRREDD